ncbi:MAG: hypothetical protein V3W34_08195 [Phycisphaerae bacterium]
MHLVVTLLGATILFADPGTALSIAAPGQPILPIRLQKESAEPPLPPGLQPQSDEPQLPPGLEEPSDAPELPPGLEKKEGGEPELPAGLTDTREEGARPEEDAQREMPSQFTGFWEGRLGGRIGDDEHERDLSIAETRIQLEWEKHFTSFSFNLTADILYDGLADRHRVDLEKGEGFVDLREANIAFSPAAFMDLKAGRQIVTWGTGDLIFINDLFPKDFKAFFIGRDEEYLKAPSDALKLSLFSDWVNLDLVYTPRFDADRFIDGSRISFFDPAQGRIVGRNAIIGVDQPDETYEDDELAVRLFRNIAAYELAFYGYKGFWKSPAGTDPGTGLATFPRLSVYGVSLRGPVGKGIANFELGYYDSRDDSDGDDPFIRNSEARFLVGYEREIGKNLTLGLQYFLEYMLDHDAYLKTLPAGAPRRDKDRHLLTGRTTLLAMNQNLTWSLFAFYSPSDKDAHVRPKAHYKINDNWSVEVGANLFNGKDDHSFFGQFKQNSNVYAGIRYGF